MIKLHFRCNEKTGECLDKCQYEHEKSDSVMIGSTYCRQCGYLNGIDLEDNWVKCLYYALNAAKEKCDEKEVEKLQEDKRFADMFYMED